MRPVDLARRHGLSTQAVRNYEDAGIIPPAHRSRTGYRDYTAAHAAGLSAYLLLIPAFGYATSRRIMQAVTSGRLDEALEYVDDGHALLARDRNTLRTVEAALSHLGASTPDTPDTPDTPGTPDTPDTTAGIRAPYSIGELARHLALNPATLRAWERAGVLTPHRDPRGYRQYLAQDVRDAELAHLLRRGGQPLRTVATVLGELRDAGSLDALTRTLEGWRRDLTSRGTAQLYAAGQLSAYLDSLDGSARTGSAPEHVPH
ncbi:MerR family DNA-binding transcriptional regulator [Streptomyces sp. NBC_00536]|uniref:MerR family DNA-binding transcriptional regulator n=1 Tax=Streptomyces sp. NBC_00536 TaxID=2975769 RepID=UPI002E809136|nr:MerR family DNA-binding transcriptional regulator [Streptomyces sp. NBC_00536]WUC83121.1 MerR family DNA-binding transcriptional regulator [Streptomyces sp. NBC_00536]